MGQPLSYDEKSSIWFSALLTKFTYGIFDVLSLNK